MKTLIQLRDELNSLHRKRNRLRAERHEQEQSTGAANLAIYHELKKIERDISYVQQGIDELLGGDCA